MPASETEVVFKILHTLAQQADRALSLEQIAAAIHLQGPQAQRYLALLDRWGIIRTDQGSGPRIGYRLTRCGQHRLEGAAH